MNDDLRLNADLYWLEHTGLSLDALLAPVDALLPAGA